MQKQHVVVRFCGDSGDGMQLTGTMFASLSAILGNEISTLPDFPAEIRAPQGTLGGVSGFQVQLGSGVYTPGDQADVIVAMNAAALKVCTLGSKFNQAGAKWEEGESMFKRDAVIIVDTDSLTAKDLEKALYTTDNPFTELGIPESVQIIPVALTQLTKEALKDMGLDNKSVLKSRNMFALGLVCWLFNRPVDKAVAFLESKFQKKPQLIAPNVKVLTDGFNYGQNLALNVQTMNVEKSTELPKGTYTSIAGNKATAWGLIAAAEKCGKRLFLGSYPITPATDILHELAKRKDLGVKAVQMEDEIAGACSAIGAAFAGVAGGLFAHNFYIINPGSFTFLASFNYLIMVVMGGLGSITGSIAGAFVVTFLSAALAAWPEFRMIIYALALILLMFYRPQGLFGYMEVTSMGIFRRIFKRGRES